MNFQSKLQSLLRFSALISTFVGCCNPVWAQPLVAPKFSTPITYAAGGDAWYIASGALLRKGVKDIVVGNGFFGTLSLIPGNGDGTFGAPRVIFRDPTGDSVTAVAVGDFNGDGLPDIVCIVSENVNPQIVVLLNRGKGKFSMSGKALLPFVGTSGPFERSIVVADLNGDGKLDVAVASMNQFVSVALGDGTGKLKSTTNYNAANFPAGLAVLDVDGNGTPDLALLDAQSSLPPDQEVARVTLPGLGNGQFGPPLVTSLGHNAIQVNPITLIGQDLNLDGKTDLITIYKNPVFVNGHPVFGSTFINSGNGKFVQKDLTFTPRPNLPDVPSPRGLGVGDFNHDGKMDAAVTVYNPILPPSDDVYVLTGNGKGGFMAKALVFTIGVSPAALIVDDFNGDGKPDIAVALSATGVAVALNTTN